MPLYEYNEGGRIVQRRLTVADRDKFPGRVPIPRRLSVCPRGQPTQGAEVLRGFYKAEQTLGGELVRKTERALGLTSDQIKKAWRED